jgi:hypothetical protein
MTRATTVKVPPTAPLFPQNPVEAASTFSLGVFEDVGSLSELVAMSGEVSNVEVGVGVVFGVAIMTALVLDADVVMGDEEE